jgi:hypothetical protein
MKNISLKALLEAEDFKAKSKETGKLVHFKSKDAYQAALKAGTHEDPNAQKGGQAKVDAKPNDMFGGDYAKDRSGEAPKADMGVDKVVYNKRTKTVGIVRMADERGETKTDADGNVNTSELEPYNPMKYPHQKDAKVAPSTQKEVDARGLWNPFAQNQPSAKADTSKAPAMKQTKVKPDSEEVQTIAKLTGVREKFIAGYINKHKLDAAALANFAKKGPLQNRLSVGRAMIGDPGNKYEKELIKKFRAGKSQLTATSLPKKASQLSDKHANLVADTLNKETGLDGFAEIDDNSGAITFTASPGNEPTYTLFIGSNQENGKPNQFRVTLEPTARQDPGGFRNKIDKSFETAEEAMAFAVKIAKKYKSELQLDDNIRFSSDYNMYDDEDTDWTSDKKTESTKLTSMIKK